MDLTVFLHDVKAQLKEPFSHKPNRDLLRVINAEVAVWWFSKSLSPIPSPYPQLVWIDGSGFLSVAATHGHSSGVAAARGVTWPPGCKCVSRTCAACFLALCCCSGLGGTACEELEKRYINPAAFTYQREVDRASMWARLRVNILSQDLDFSYCHCKSK